MGGGRCGPGAGGGLSGPGTGGAGEAGLNAPVPWSTPQDPQNMSPSSFGAPQLEHWGTGPLPAAAVAAKTRVAPPAGAEARTSSLRRTPQLVQWTSSR
jgi:hypothetical protein